MFLGAQNTGFCCTSLLATATAVRTAATTTKVAELGSSTLPATAILIVGREGNVVASQYCCSGRNSATAAGLYLFLKILTPFLLFP